MSRLSILAVVVFAWLAGGVNAAAAESVRNQEIFECRSGEIVTWGDGLDRPAVASPLRFTYDPTGSPAWFSPEQVADMVALAAAAWSECGVPSQRVPWSRNLKPQRNLVFVQWDEKGSRGNFGLANFKLRTLSLGPKAFAMLRSQNPAYDARESLQMVISHEMGHLFGLMAHSRRCVDVMSYYTNGKGDACFSRDPSQMESVVEYRSSFPTACDIDRCRKANGKTALPDGRLGPPARRGGGETD
jgi:hypothetical protein